VASRAPADEIVRAAAHEGFDPIVAGTSARMGVSRLLLGSVAEQVTRHAPCAVLVVREPMDRGD
jgi:nucleotide-binding universal stress UspA family protein